MSAKRVHKQSRSEGGYALIIMLAILIAGSLYFVVKNLDKVAMTTEQTNNTGLALQTAKDALLNYAATYPDDDPTQPSARQFGHLPCPDTTGDGISDTPCGAQNVTQIGLLPFKTLGLPDLRDSNGNCLWYAVSGTFKNLPATQQLNWDTQGQLAIRNAQGATVSQPEDAQGGAAAVIFAAGPPLAGQTRVPVTPLPPLSVCHDDTSTHTHFIDSDPSPGAAPSNKVANATTTLWMGDASSSTNNDMLAWVSPLDVFTRVKARKSANANDFVGRIRTLSNNLANTLNATSSLPAPLSPVTIGSLTYGTLPTTSFSGFSGQLAADLQHWQSQYRYAKCTSNAKCINSGSCTGALLFAGERTSRGPRTATEVASSTLSSFFEDVGTSLNLSNLTTGGTTFTSVYGATSTSSGLTITNPANAASGDDIICLNPLTPPFSISGFSTFQNTQQASAPVLAVSTPSPGLSQLTLGSLVSLSDLYGCSWHASALSLTTGMRAYFRFYIQDGGAGFTFTLADAGTNSSTNMCGKFGASLGYSGDNGATSPIKSPKLALEFDTRYDAGRQDLNDHHAAFVFWAGAARTDDQDNAHGLCATDVTPNVPCNPTSTSAGVKSLGVLNGASSGGNIGIGRPAGDVYVRIDIVPDNSTTPSTYALKAYITESTTEKSNCELDTLTNDVATLVASPTSPCNMSPTLTASLQTTMSSAYLGFTVGQNAGFSGDQNIIIDNFQARGR